MLSECWTEHPTSGKGAGFIAGAQLGPRWCARSEGHPLLEHAISAKLEGCEDSWHWSLIPHKAHMGSGEGAHQMRHRAAARLFRTSWHYSVPIVMTESRSQDPDAFACNLHHLHYLHAPAAHQQLGGHSAVRAIFTKELKETQSRTWRRPLLLSVCLIVNKQQHIALSSTGGGRAEEGDHEDAEQGPGQSCRVSAAAGAGRPFLRRQVPRRGRQAGFSFITSGATRELSLGKTGNKLITTHP